MPQTEKVSLEQNCYHGHRPPYACWRVPWQSVIPPGHDFLNPNVFISKPAKDIAVKLFEKADDRNPDLHDMYIYNGKVPHHTLTRAII